MGESELTITESRPSDVLARLHESAHAEREYLFAAREATAADLLLVAWDQDEAIAYIAATDNRGDGFEVWEHLVTPFHRGRGLGERLLLEAVRRAVPDAMVTIDPLAQLDRDRIADYYGRLGLALDPVTGDICATATGVMRAAAERLGTGSEAQTAVTTILAAKAPGVVTIDPDATVKEAVSLLNTHQIGALIVSTDGSRVEGLLSERDVLRGVGDRDDFLDQLVGDVVSHDVPTCTAQDTISDVMQRMTNKRIRHMPIMTTGRLTGIVSIGDLVSYRLQELERRG